MLHDGLYEQIINKALDTELATTDKLNQTAPIDTAEASKVLAKYVAEVVERGLDNLRDNGGDLNAQVALANQIITTIQSETKEADFDALSVAERAEQLLALYGRQNSIWAIDEKAQVVRPETSIAQSSLFTGAIHEPQMYTELRKEIVSCNRIDMLVSFIKWSGLRLIMDELTTFTQNGGTLRVITTSYMGATDVKAIEELRKLPNTQIRISYDTKRTRLHAKTYVFYRDTGFTTAYVGSSNLSNAAISSGLEWNVKVTRKDLPETIDKIAATFESYWNSFEFEYYSEDQKERLARALQAEKYFDSNNDELYTMDIQPYSYQQEILDKLEAERTVRGYTRNLVVAATGTGKTVISALDYKRFRKQHSGQPCRLLFVAHREEILKQSLYTFRASYGNSAGLVTRIASFEEDTGLALNLANFLDYYHLDPRSIYKFSSFSRLCARADVIDDFSEPIEETMTKALSRLAVIDSRRWISFLLDILPRLNTVNYSAMPAVERRMLQMFYITVWGKAADPWNGEEMQNNLRAMASSPVMLSEMTALLQYKYDHIDFIDAPVDVGFDCPLDLHCTYTRDQLLIAMDFMKPSTVREGVKWLPDQQLDVFFVTLNKADKDYSPTTMYNDYSINERLFHWQSQSTTAEASPTGQRYIHHKERGSRVLLFVREFKADRISGSAEAYTYLGTANYVKHEGEKPMNITWWLDHPIPAKYLKKTNKLVVG